ncbi:MAG: SGNH/GDSL hydrolase family protein [Lentisphaerota bacterium]
MQRIKLMLLTLSLVLTGVLSAGTESLKNGDRLAILGDSITEQKIYSCYIAVYILACSGLDDVRVFQFGWSGERAPNMVDRIYNDVISWNPTIMTTCYGMNDGGYKKYEPSIGNTYRESIQKIIDVAKKNNARIIVGTPGIVDLDTFKLKRNIPAAEYNENLGELAKIDAELARKNNVGLADIFCTMSAVNKLAKTALGNEYHVAGPDGIHPRANGQLIMAYVFLKALGMDGRIANIEMDYSGTTKVSSGHAILKQERGTVEMESKRYPVCFPNKTNEPNNPASILPFLPFQQDLNSFELKVTNLPKAKAEVKWGDKTKQFSRTDLEKGINLAAEFTQNPFSTQFDKIFKGIKEKQEMETWMIKGLITSFRSIKTFLPDAEQDAEIQASILFWRRKLHEREAGLYLNCKKLVIPIVHRITVTPQD